LEEEEEDDDEEAEDISSIVKAWQYPTKTRNNIVHKIIGYRCCDRLHEEEEQDDDDLVGIDGIILVWWVV
jgi:hypothetical protein